MCNMNFFAGRKVAASILASVVLAFFSNANAAFLINFEGIADGDPITTQYFQQGVTFLGGSAYAAVSGAVGGSLNEIDFPPTSNDTVLTNVAFDTSGNPTIFDAISIQFTSPLSQVSGYFVYGGSQALVISAYTDSSFATLVDTKSLGENLGIPSLVNLSGSESIGYLRITGDTDSQFTLDNLSGTPYQSHVIAEPNTLLLLFGTLPLLVVFLNRFRQI